MQSVFHPCQSVAKKLRALTLTARQVFRRTNKKNGPGSLNPGPLTVSACFTPAANFVIQDDSRSAGLNDTHS
jgi:hypothetical protein